MGRAQLARVQVWSMRMSARCCKQVADIIQTCHARQTLFRHALKAMPWLSEGYKATMPVLHRDDFRLVLWMYHVCMAYRYREIATEALHPRYYTFLIAQSFVLLHQITMKQFDQNWDRKVNSKCPPKYTPKPLFLSKNPGNLGISWRLRQEIQVQREGAAAEDAKSLECADTQLETVEAISSIPPLWISPASAPAPPSSSVLQCWSGSLLPHSLDKAFKEG